MNKIAATTPVEAKPSRWRLSRPTLRQSLLIFVALSLVIHLMFGVGGVLPEKIAEMRQARRDDAARQLVLAAKEQKKRAEAARTQAALQETRKAVQSDLKSQFDTIVENQLKPDVADQVWQQVLAKLTQDLNAYAQSVGDVQQSDAQVNAKKDQVQAQMLEEMLKHLKDMTTRELAEKYVARVEGDVAPKVADYYKQQIDKRIGAALRDAGAKIINDDVAAVHAERQATNQALNKAETQVNTAQSDLTQAQHHLEQQIKAAATAKTPAQKQAVETAVQKDQAAIDRATQSIKNAEQLLNSVAKNDVLPDPVKKSITTASTHPAATQAVAEANQSVAQSKHALGQAAQPENGTGTPNSGTPAGTGAPGPKSPASGNTGNGSGVSSDGTVASSGNSSTQPSSSGTGNGKASAGGAAVASSGGSSTQPNTSGTGNGKASAGGAAVASSGGSSTQPSSSGSGNGKAVANAGGANTGPSGSGSAGGTAGNSGAAANGSGGKPAASGNGGVANAGAAAGGMAEGHGGSLADAANSAGAAVEAAGKFRDAIREAKAAADKDARENPDASVAARLAVKHARDDEIKEQLDKAFEKKVAAQALPRLSAKLTDAFKKTLGQAGITDDAVVKDVAGKVADVLAKKVPGGVQAGDTGTALLTKSEKLDDVSDAKAGNGAAGDGAAGNGKDDGKDGGKSNSGKTSVASKDGGMAGGNGDTGADGDDGAAGGTAGAGHGGKHQDGDKAGAAADATGKDSGGADDAKGGDGKGTDKLSGHEKAVADKMGKAAQDLTDHGMGAIAGDESADDGFAGMAAGRKRGGRGGEGDADGTDGLVELTSRVGHLVAGMKGGGGGAGDGDGAGGGAAAGGGAGAGAGGGLGDGGPGGGLSRLRREAFEREMRAREAIRADDVADDPARYAALTAGIHDRDPNGVHGQVMGRQGASGDAAVDIADMEAQAKEQWRPAALVVPPAPADSKEGPVGVAEKTEAYKPKFKNIRFAVIPYRSKPIKIDGDLSEWADVPALPMYAAGPGVDDKSLKHFPQEVKVQWDNTGFYVAYDVKDADDKITKVKSDDFWQGDGVEIWVDTLNTKEKVRTESSHQFWAWVDGAIDNPKQVGGEAVEYGGRHEFIPFGQDMIQTASKKTPLGWTIEVHIPAERFRKLHLDPGRIIGMNFSICTGTGLYYYWAGTTEISTSTRPDTWGDVLLAGSDGKLECVDKLASELKQTETSKPLTSLEIGQPLRIRVTDPDMNLSDRVKDKISVVAASRHGGRQVVILEETTNTSGVFEGAIRTALEIGDPSPTALTLYDGEPVDITYTDQCRADGSQNVPVHLTVPTASAVTGLAAK